MKTAAVVGCGKPPSSKQGHKVGWGIGYAHGEGYRRAFPQVKLLAVDPNTENLDAFCEHFGIDAQWRFSSLDALLKQHTPDAISICTWPALHVPQAIQSARAGVKAITVEKPVGLDGFQVHELINVMHKTRARIAVAHQRRYEPWFIETRKLLDEGALGNHLVIEARVGDGWDMLSWTVHWFDMANFLFDALPRSILAGVEHTGQRRYGHAVEDASVVLVEYDEHRQAVFITGPAALPNFGVTVRGQQGMLMVGNPIRLWTTEGYREIHVDTTVKPFAELFKKLWETVGNDRISECDLSRCAPATLMAYAAHQSALRQQRICFPLHTWYAPLEVLQHPSATPDEHAGVSIALVADKHYEVPGMSMSGRVGLQQALEALGHRVQSLEASDDLSPDNLNGADVLVLYHTQQKTRPSHKQVLEPWFKHGKPVVVSHCGIGAYADWPEYRRWIGRYWVWGGESLPPSRHPHTPCELLVEDPTRFGVPWHRAWLPNDEVYQGLGQASSIAPLVTAKTPDGSEQAYAWQVREHPNVVVWLAGHRRTCSNCLSSARGCRHVSVWLGADAEKTQRQRQA